MVAGNKWYKFPKRFFFLLNRPTLVKNPSQQTEHGRKKVDLCNIRADKQQKLAA